MDVEQRPDGGRTEVKRTLDGKARQHNVGRQNIRCKTYTQGDSWTKVQWKFDKHQIEICGQQSMGNNGRCPMLHGSRQTLDVGNQTLSRRPDTITMVMLQHCSSQPYAVTMAVLQHVTLWHYSDGGATAHVTGALEVHITATLQACGATLLCHDGGRYGQNF